MLVLSGQIKPVDRLAFAPDGTTFAASGRKSLDIWRLGNTTEPRHRLSGRFKQGVGSIRFCTPEGHLVIANGTEIIGIDPESGDELWSIEPDPNSPIAGIDVTADGRSLVTAHLLQFLCKAGYQVWSMTGRKAPRRRCSMDGTGDRICRDVSFFPGGDRLAFAEEDPGEPAFVNIFTSAGEPVRVVEAPFKQIQHVLVSPDGTYLAAVSPRAVTVWNVKRLDRAPITLSSSSRLAFTGIAFHPSGQYLAATSNDTTVKLYDTATWQVARTFTWNVGRLRSVAFSPDGTLAAVGSDTGKIVVWDVDL